MDSSKLTFWKADPKFKPSTGNLTTQPDSVLSSAGDIAEDKGTGFNPQ